MTTSLEAIERVDSETLHRELRRLISLSAETLKQAALIYAELYGRGEEFPYLSKALANTLSQVATGALDSDAALAFGRSGHRIRLVTTLPLVQQRRLACGEKIPVITPVRGRLETRAVCGTQLTVGDMRRVVVEGRILSESDQRERMNGRQVRHTSAAEPLRRLTINLSASLLAALQIAADKNRQLVGEFVVEILSRELGVFDEPRMAKAK